MIILITAEEISNKHLWAEFCELKGVDEYALADGMDEQTQYELSEGEAIELGIILSNN